MNQKMEVDIEKEAEKIIQLLANTLKMNKDSLCLCGTGDKYENCCLQKNGTELSYMGEAIEACLKLKDSKGLPLEGIPQGLFKAFEEASLKRLKCLYPGCTQTTISCHLIPENILRRSFGGHCLEYKLRDGEPYGQFVKTGIGGAATLPVFCSTHDCAIFKEIDPLDIDFTNKKQLFLLAFKAITFSLRRVQYLLGIDCQTAVFTPVLTLRNLKNNPPAGTNFQINISFLEEQYIRFILNHAFFTKAMDALLVEDYDFFSHSHRSIAYEENIFCAGFLNLSHDLGGNRINSPHVSMGMTFNVFTKNKKLHVLFGCPDGPTKTAYAPFLDQLDRTDDETFITVVNNILTVAVEKPLLPEGFHLDADELKKISQLRQYAGLCLKSSETNIFDLKNKEQAIAFITA